VSHGTDAFTRGLLRILFLWHGALSADSGERQAGWLLPGLRRQSLDFYQQRSHATTGSPRAIQPGPALLPAIPSLML
jgi:hypothetical protein